MMRNICAIFVLFCLLMACGKKKKTMAGSDEVNMQEFVDFFETVKLPFTYADTSFPAKEHDSLLISTEIYNQFTPDSIVGSAFGAIKPKIYPIGKYADKNGDLYIFSRAVSKEKKAMLVTVYNKEKKFIAGFEAMAKSKNASTATFVTIDAMLNINKKITKKLADGTEVSGNDIYVLNEAAHDFMLVMTDSIGDDVEMINPIDTLPKTFKYAGDYGKGNRNLVSIRDDKKQGQLQFFIHLEDKSTGCKGEEKGVATITSPTTAEYRQAGDPCVLQFVFSNNNITLKEVEGCGSRMGALDCSFDGSYAKKKKKMTEAVPK